MIKGIVRELARAGTLETVTVEEYRQIDKLIDR